MHFLIGFILGAISMLVVYSLVVLPRLRDIFEKEVEQLHEAIERGEKTELEFDPIQDLDREGGLGETAIERIKYKLEQEEHSG